MHRVQNSNLGIQSPKSVRDTCMRKQNLRLATNSFRSSHAIHFHFNIHTYRQWSVLSEVHMLNYRPVLHVHLNQGNNLRARSWHGLYDTDVFCASYTRQITLIMKPFYPFTPSFNGQIVHPALPLLHTYNSMFSMIFSILSENYLWSLIIVSGYSSCSWAWCLYMISQQSTRNKNLANKEKNKEILISAASYSFQRMTQFTILKFKWKSWKPHSKSEEKKLAIVETIMHILHGNRVN